MWVLVVISVAILVFGFVKGFENPVSEGGAITTVEILLYWTYFMVAAALVSVIVVGLCRKAVVNPKSLISVAVVLVGVAAICAAVYYIAPGKPLTDFNGEELPSAGTLKLTDTVLYLTYLAAGAAIVSIVIGEIIIAIRNKK